MNLTQLKNIGLTDGEIKVYSALLKRGETTKTDLAKASGVSLSKIYDVANRLLEKGLISAVRKNDIKHFSPANPQQLNTFLKRKQQELEHEEKIVQTLLPTLLAQYNQPEQPTDVEVFYGWDGMTTVFDDIIDNLGKGECNYVFGASPGYDSKQADRFFGQYYKKKLKKGFGTKIIFNENLRKNKTRTEHFRKKPNEIRFLHNDTFAEINFHHNTVLFIMLLQQPIVIRVTNQEATNSFKKFFNTMWTQAKK